MYPVTYRACTFNQAVCDHQRVLIFYFNIRPCQDKNTMAGWHIEDRHRHFLECGCIKTPRFDHGGGRKEKHTTAAISTHFA